MLPGYFTFPEAQTTEERREGGLIKMAPETQGSGKMPGEAMNTAAVTSQDLLDVGLDLKSHFEATVATKIDLVLYQLAKLTSGLKDVSRTAETAMELGLALQDENKRLQRSEHQLRLKVAALEAQSQAMTLKFHGLPEMPEFNNNLTSSLATWLASVLQLEDRVSPTILNAYRLGPLAAVHLNFPHDVVAQFLYPQSRDAILKCLRSGGPMKFDGCIIQVLLDLIPSVLVKRRNLKPVTDTLSDNNVRFQCSPMSDILVFRDGKQLCADDIESGRNLLGLWTFVYLWISKMILRQPYPLRGRIEWKIGWFARLNSVTVFQY